MRSKPILALIVISMLVFSACGAQEAEQEPTATPTATPSPTPSFDAQAFFGGKDMTFFVGFSPGGGYDTFARLVAAYMPKYIPGNPKIIVQNLPGSGGLRGLQSMLQAPANGLNIGYAHPRHVNAALLTGDVDGFEIDDIVPIGTPRNVERSMIWYVRRDAATSIQEMIASGETYLLGATSPVGPGYPVSNTVFERVGAPIHVVYGYGGHAELHAALDRDELQVGLGLESELATYPEWIEDRTFVPVFYMLSEPEIEPNYVSYVSATGQEGIEVPHYFDAFNVEPGVQEHINLGLELFNAFGFMLVTHSDAPAEAVGVIREAFQAVVGDSQFIQGAEAGGYDTGYGDWRDLERLISDTKKLAADPERLQEFLSLTDEVD